MTATARYPLLHVYAGRAWRYQTAWEIFAVWAPARWLMTRPADEGRELLCLFGWAFVLSWSRRAIRRRERGWWWPRMWFRTWSDAEEIADRWAERCSP